MISVLVVDDSKVDRLLIGGLLGDGLSVEVEYASNGAEALERLGSHPPCLVVTDLMMPQMGGLELVQRVAEEHPSVPIVLVTSQGSEEVAVEALRGGAASYVPKESLANDLVETVESLLEKVEERRDRARALESMRRVELSFEVGNERLLLGSLSAYLQERLAELDLSDETERRRISVALEEALVNAAEHGNLELDSQLRETDRAAYVELANERATVVEPYCERRVHLTARLTPEELRFLIRDEGVGFEPSSLPDPTDAANLLKASGRGVLLMRTFMDRVEYNDVGNAVTLVKRLER